ncbi:PQQ-binding-like beta-propeller repeat protein [Paenarthrobacter nitroguajacolicus]|uniref:outer membrane protein assembly factor BamB family protein n=1 Tax=Paenarthrobacter nitroguajacolicus TaxID=211146 RepID=UPI00248C15E0|nr:PQQ-binding-like beta-propeller repeat protein [Paenarthrobacter nitroguajacolicus]MDI2035730.1 hypothetical protein [Paenarthrobacter nitroguajacolicus]
MAIAAAATLSACTLLPLPLPAASKASEPPASAAPPERNKETATAAWEVTLDPIGQPVVADGVALVYTKGSAGVEAHALSVATGKELWTQPVHPGYDAPGNSLEPAVTRTASGSSAAIFLQAAEAPADIDTDVVWWTSPVAFDLSTGKELYRGRPELVSTRPFACDDLFDMCFIAFDEEAKSVEHWVDLETGEESGGADINELTGVFQPVGKELYAVEENGVEKLAHVSYGEVLWQIELEKVFGKGASTDLGWQFTYSEKLDLYVGSVGINPTGVDPGKFTGQSLSLNLRESTKTVGFRASSGRVLWTADGSTLECSRTMGLEDTKMGAGTALPVRCEYMDGYIEFPAGKYRGVRSKAVGYDPLTGDAVWESKPAYVYSWDEYGIIPSASHGEFLIAGTFFDSSLTDTHTGKPRGAGFDDGFICWKNATYTVPPNGPYKDEPGGEIAAGAQTAFPCLKGGGATLDFTYGALTDVTTTDQDMAVISLEGKVAGYKLLKEFV